MERALHINHIDLQVPDVAATRDFFIEHFGFSLVCSHSVEGFAILRDSAGLELGLGELAGKRTGAGATGESRCDIGFMLPSREAFEAMLVRLRAIGIEFRHAPADPSRVSAFSCLAPGGVALEIAWRPTYGAGK
jgi:catechol 2,3-dioxygenase-like lactoylglutathione lyase family enzyme